MTAQYQAVFEVTLTTPERLQSVEQLMSAHNTSTTVTISPYTTRYAQASFTFTFRRVALKFVQMP